MRISNFLLAVACSLILSIRLAGQAAAEYGAVTAAGTTGAAATGKGVSKSIGGVFDGLNKKLGKVAGEAKPAETSKRASVKEVTPPVAASPASSAAKPEPVRLVKASEIRIGTLRADLVRDFGKPSVQTSQADENGFVETFFYPGADDEVVVTLRGGKVTRVLPPPDEEPAIAPSSAVPTQKQNTAARP